MPVLSAEALLSRHLPLINKIKELAGVPDHYDEHLYQPALTNFARFVQQLPASEVHHHAGLGGLLKHTLEVVSTSLSLRRAYLLPSGAEPEQLNQKQDLWTYAVFTAALCHDLGKPAIDQIVTLYDENSNSLGRWDPWSHFIEPPARYYQVDFVRQKPYRLHERAALLLTNKIIPTEGIAWLASDHAVLSFWVACISGDLDNAGALGEIIQKADGDSVARNLGAEPADRFPTARAKPIHEKLLTGLRYLLNEGDLPLNRNGAAGWLSGDDLWLVSKRTIDALRNHLVKEGHSGIPTQNGRIFDVLQEHGLIVPNQDQAIWRAIVKGDDWEHELTLIRISASTIWPNTDAWPELFPGKIIPTERITAQQTKPSHTTDASTEDSHGIESGGENSPLFQTQSDKFETDSRLRFEGLEDNETTARAENNKLSKSNRQSIGKQFFSWLRENVENKIITVNNPQAKIHVVEEGVLLVSPSIFKAFVTCTKVDTTWESVQKKVLKLSLHQKTATGLNIHKYKVTGKNRSSSVNGILMTELSVIFDKPYPKTNPHLSLSKGG